MPPIATSIPAALAARAQAQPDDVAYTFIDYDYDPAGTAESLTWSEVHERVQIIAGKLGKLGAPGDRAVILAPQSLDYVVAFLGAIQAGFVAVPLSMPMFRQHDERVSGVMADATPVAVLTTSDVIEDVRKYGQVESRSHAPKFIEVDTLDFDTPAKPPASVALPKAGYIQYTSGSTRRPAGVVVTHQNIFENMEQILPDYFEAYDEPPADLTVVTWLPLYHDMGLLVGVFLGMRMGRGTVLMSPVAFMQKPARWIQQLALNPHTFTAAPNFAYELAVKRTKDEDLAGLDLSGVVVMINGAAVQRAVRPLWAARGGDAAVLRAGRGHRVRHVVGRGAGPDVGAIPLRRAGRRSGAALRRGCRLRAHRPRGAALDDGAGGRSADACRGPGGHHR